MEIRKETTNPKNVIFAHLIFLLCLIFVSYFSCLKYGFVWDDKFFYGENFHKLMRYDFLDFFNHDVWSFSSLNKEGNSSIYRPIYVYILYINQLFFSDSSSTHHFINLMFHFICSSLFYLTLFLLTDGRKLYLILFATIIFALNPLHVESVVWISALCHLLVTTFILMSFILYLVWSRTANRYAFFGSVAFYLLSLFTLEITLLYPLILVAYDYLLLKKIKIRAYIPFFGCIFIYFFARHFAIGEALPISLNRIDAFVDLLNMLSGYVKNLFFPWPQGIYLDAPDFGWVNHLFSFAIITLFVLVLVMRKKEDSFRFLFFSVCWIVVFLLPLMAGAFSGKQLFAPRGLYLPSVGVAFLFYFFALKYERNKALKLFMLAYLFIAIYSITIYSKNWMNDLTLYKKIYMTSKKSSLACLGYGEKLLENGFYHEATKVLLEAEENDSDSEHLPEIYAYLGTANALVENYNLSKQYFFKSIRIKPNNSLSKLGLGNISMIEGSFEKAKEYYLAAYKDDKLCYEACYNLHTIFKTQGNSAMSIKYFNFAQEIKGSN